MLMFIAQYSKALALQPCYYEVPAIGSLAIMPGRTQNLAAMQLLQIKKSIGFEFDHWLLLLWEGRLSQEEVSLQAMHTTLVGPLAHPGSNATYGFFQFGLG